VTAAQPLSYVTPPPPAAARAVEPLDPVAMIFADALRDAVLMGALSSPRSLQVSIGASEIGSDCPRQQAYRAAGVAPVNFPDPLRSLVGIGVHAALADIFTRADRGTKRYLVETPVSYRDVPGTCDLFDRRRRLVIDWKSTLLRKVRQIMRDGPPRRYIIQAHIYGAALAAAGEQVEWVALAYVPIDSTLDDIYLWHAPFERNVADEAIDRYLAIAGGPPAASPAKPSRLCGWCSHYRSGSSDPAVACPGDSNPTTTTGAHT
jgi:hypothetical protein